MRRAGGIALAAGCAAALALAGCGGSSGSAHQDPAQLIPATAPDAFVAEIGPGTPARRQAFAFADALAPGKQDAQALLSRALDRGTPPGDRFSQAIDPNLGDRAALYFDAAGGDGPQSFSGAAIIASPNPQKLLDALDRSDPSTKAVSHGSYRGARYGVSRDGSADGVVDGFVVGASDVAHFKAVVDAGKGTSLADTARFSQARDHAGADPLLFGYGDLDRLRSILQRAGAQAGLLAGGLAHAGGAFTLTVRTTARRLTVEAAAPAAASPAANAKPAPAEPLAALPSDTWAAVALGGIGPALRQGLGRSGAARLLSGAVKSATGLDLEADLLSWAGGVTAYMRGGGGLLPLSGAGVDVTTLDRARSQAALPHIAAALGALAGGAVHRSGGGYVVRSGPLAVALRQGGSLVRATAGLGFAGGSSGSGTFGSSALYRDARAALGGLTPALVVSGPQLAGLVRAGTSTPSDRRIAAYLANVGTIAAGSRTADGTRDVRLVVTVSGSR